MRLDALKASGTPGASASAELVEVEGALQDALRDMRAIAAGLRMPELAQLDVREVAARAVSDHVRRTGMAVEVTIDRVPDQVALPVKIALYRAIQELLSNAFRHGRGAGVRLRSKADDESLPSRSPTTGPVSTSTDLAGGARPRPCRDARAG